MGAPNCQTINVGLRIDVDTFRGTRLGVPNLCRLLAAQSMTGTFYFSVGPDNMGRHLWRLLRPAFLRKMLRSKAPGLYGWDILLRGTFGSGPVIGERLGPVIKAAAEAGHEIGFHAWDHQAWQAHIDTMSAEEVRRVLDRGVALLTRVTGRPPVTSAVPGWKCTEVVLAEKARFPFRYNSDCRGTGIFLPQVGGRVCGQPQVPVTLPTYDEAVGREGVSDLNYNDWLLAKINPDRLNVLTIHAEVEGVARQDMFVDFLAKLRRRGASFVPLGALLPAGGVRDVGTVVKARIAGREGWVAVQGEAAEGGARS